ncbi:hypothetical protein Q7P37_002486 [Cladosporium fusiforme]
MLPHRCRRRPPPPGPPAPLGPQDNDHVVAASIRGPWPSTSPPREVPRAPGDLAAASPNPPNALPARHPTPWGGGGAIGAQRPPKPGTQRPGRVGSTQRLIFNTQRLKIFFAAPRHSPQNAYIRSPESPFGLAGALVASYLGPGGGGGGGGEVEGSDGGGGGGGCAGKPSNASEAVSRGATLPSPNAQHPTPKKCPAWGRRNGVGYTPVGHLVVEWWPPSATPNAPGATLPSSNAQRPTPTASNAQYFDALRKRRDSPAEFNTTPTDPQSRLVPKNLAVAATEHQTQHPTPRGRPCHHPTPNSRRPTPSTPNAHGHPAPEGTPRPCSGATTRMAHRPAHPHGCKPGDLAVAPTAVAPVAAPRHEHRIAMAPPVRGRPCRPCAAASKPDGTPQGDAGLRSAARNNKATRLLTRPGHTSKSSAKDSSQRAVKLLSGNYLSRLLRERSYALLRSGAEAYSYPRTTCWRKSPRSGMDSNLEAFSYYPADGSFAALPGRTAAKTNYLNPRFLSY